MNTFKVISPGIATFVEDLGRYGYYHLGIPPGGALDQASFIVANALVGNDQNMAGLEMALMPAKLEFEKEAIVAVCGAHTTPKINGQEMPSHTALKVPAGGVLEFSYFKKGARAYLAIAGGVDVPLVMGSRSTYPLGGIGGFKGRKLEAGDILPIGTPTGKPSAKSLDSAYHLKLDEIEELRVVLGLQDYKLTEQSLNNLFSDVFVVSTQADRLGYRFKNGQKFTYKDLPQPFGAGANPSNITDACYPVGSMQAPGGNEPIVLQRDAPSGGGFAMYCTLISCDLDRLGQFAPNQKVRFKAVSMQEALKARKAYQERIRAMVASLV
ncbi:biotin-dependent carboxyltransferase family protein [Helicobacter ailurogastricus]|uniref:5-oxoprolinase subunit C family protein n=1 Tax=Helicobacter ailurogastricus TaxID=1578720 RepID=UPI000CF1A17F|nr:biotin-dependent carboxyltransferase family protein [Helicobacter ailurogastricus]GMB91735.1 biotin-dependent carboxyltransferase family protein [Helicobacter ailurogastricus]